MIIIGDGGHAKVVREVIALAGKGYELGDAFGIVAIGNNEHRMREVAAHPELTFPWWRHPRAVLPLVVDVGEGTIIMAGAIVQPGARIGKHVILNTGCTVDHDCVIGDYAHIAPGAHLCGGVTVGEGALVGVGARAVPGAVIAPWSLVKAGETAR